MIFYFAHNKHTLSYLYFSFLVTCRLASPYETQCHPTMVTISIHYHPLLHIVSQSHPVSPYFTPNGTSLHPPLHSITLPYTTSDSDPIEYRGINHHLTLNGNFQFLSLFFFFPIPVMLLEVVPEVLFLLPPPLCPPFSLVFPPSPSWVPQRQGY